METITLSVPDISCSHCVQTIKSAVSKLDGVDNVSVDPEKKKVVVSFTQGKTTVDSIRSAIEDQGYTIS